mgnify:CR=1 FL=1
MTGLALAILGLAHLKHRKGARAAIRVAPSLVVIPGICVALAILSIGTLLSIFLAAVIARWLRYRIAITGLCLAYFATMCATVYVALRLGVRVAELG